MVKHRLERKLTFNKENVQIKEITIILCLLYTSHQLLYMYYLIGTGNPGRKEISSPLPSLT